jgi:hypothetical protein
MNKRIKAELDKNSHKLALSWEITKDKILYWSEP